MKSDHKLFSSINNNLNVKNTPKSMDPLADSHKTVINEKTVDNIKFIEEKSKLDISLEDFSIYLK